MQRTRPAACGFVLLWFVVSAVPQSTPPIGEQRPQLPAFRSDITLIPVDVRVVDRNGKPVTDLTATDFTVLEDGIRQQIRHFSTHRFTPATPPRGARLPLRQPLGATIAPQQNRVFLIVLGRGRLQEPSEGFDGLLRFVRARLLPQDQVAVMGYNRATDFTVDHERIAQVLERYRGRHERIEALFEQWEAPVPGAGPALATLFGSLVPRWIQQEIDLLFDTPGLITTRQLTPARMPAADRMAEDARLTREASEKAEADRERRPTARDDEPAILPFGDYDPAMRNRTVLDLEKIYSGIEYLRYVEGEKHLIFVTDKGVSLPRLDDEMSVAAVASDARVVIDTIQTGGMPSVQSVPGFLRREDLGPAGVPGNIAALWALRHISELTGGQSSLTEYTRTAVDRIDDTTRFQYLLGYYPSNQRWDGRYRRIQVRVNRPGMTVLYRHGYYASAVLVPLNGREFMAYRRIMVAANYDKEVGDIELTIRASLVPRQAGPGRQALVEVTMDPSRITVTESGGRLVSALDVAVFCTDAKENLVGEAWNRIDLKVSPETHAKLRRDGIPYTVRLPLTGPLRYVKVIVYDYAADLLGSRVATVR